MANYRSLIFFAALLFQGAAAWSQENRYMVFFTDKAGTSYSIAEPLEFLSSKALDRRVRKGVGVSAMDIPVNAHYVDDVKATGADVFFTTRWLNGVLVQCDPALIASIEGLPFVDRVEFVAPQPRLISTGRSKVNLRKKNGAVGVETRTQLQMLGIPQMHADDFRGEGITIAFFDGGFSGVDETAPFQHVFSEGRLDGDVSFDFVTNSRNVFQFDDHGTEVFSVAAGYIPDTYTGGAFEANFQLYVTEDVATEYRVEEYNWLFAAERADSAGADIINSSLGYYDFDLQSMQYSKEQMDGQTAVVTKAAQWAADRGMLVVCSAGNEGNISSWGIITAPADARDVIAVGNVNAQGQVSPSSSRGPTADGRIKPDLSALGTGVRTIVADGTLDFSSGTSLSAPLITSLAAGVWQRFPELTNTQLIDALKESASRAGNPDEEIGFGIPHYTAVSNYLDQKVQRQVFEVFPNPIADTVLIRPFDPEQIPGCIVEVISAQGQIIRKDSVAFSWLNRSHVADLSQLAPGLYYIRLSAGTARYVFKMVKV